MDTTGYVPIDGYNGKYLINIKGEALIWCRVMDKYRVLKPINQTYLYYHLYKNSKMSRMSVSKLIGTYFIPNPLNKNIINHINGIKHDNRIENLEWVTHQENTIHAFKTGLNKGPINKGVIHDLNLYSMRVFEYNSACELIKEWSSIRDLLDSGFRLRYLSLILRGRAKSYYGRFISIEEIDDISKLRKNNEKRFKEILAEYITNGGLQNYQMGLRENKKIRNYSKRIRKQTT